MNWNKMAPYWDLLENFGFSPHLADTVLDHIKSPVLVVGGGSGLVPYYLKKLNYKVDSIDSSKCMCLISKIRRNIDIINTSFLDYKPIINKYSTVILSTGVITNSLTQYKRNKMFMKAKELLGPSGVVIVAVFGSNMSEEIIDNYFGFSDKPTTLECFIGESNLYNGLKKIAKKRNINTQTVLNFLDSSGEYLNFVFDLVKKLSVRLLNDGIDPNIFISDNLVFENTGFNANQLEILRDDLIESDFNLLEERWIDKSNVYIFVVGNE